MARSISHISTVIAKLSVYVKRIAQYHEDITELIPLPPFLEANESMEYFQILLFFHK